MSDYKDLFESNPAIYDAYCDYFYRAPCKTCLHRSNDDVLTKYELVCWGCTHYHLYDEADKGDRNE